MTLHRSRRRVLRDLLLAVGWASLGSPAAASSQRVVVVGAGVAGLGAAATLRSAGADVVVVEGRDRPGGRVHTDRSLGFPVDLGAAWIEGWRGNPVAEIARGVGVATAPTDEELLGLFDRGRRVPDVELDGLERALEELLESASEIAESRDRDLSARSAVDLVLRGWRTTESLRRLLEWALETIAIELAAPLDELSAWYPDEADELGGGDRLVVGGYDRIVAHLARGLDVRLGQTVEEIRSTPAGVRVSTAGGTFEGDRAVVTLPIGVLKAGSVRFDPPLPDEKAQAIRRVGSGIVEKVVLRFDGRPFWPSDVHMVGVVDGSAGGWTSFLNLWPFAEQAVLVGFSVDRGAGGRSDDETVEAALASLRAGLRSGTPPPTGSIVTRWAADPWSRGSYSFTAVGSRPADRDLLAAPVGRLYFAGEATHRRFPATVHGALLSGRRSALEILRAT